MSGKTTFIMNCLEHQESVFTRKFHTITYFLPKEAAFTNDSFATELKKRFPNVTVEYGLPEVSRAFTSSLPKLWIIDDQMKEIGNAPELDSLFTRTSHHEDVSVMFTVSNTLKLNYKMLKNFKSGAFFMFSRFKIITGPLISTLLETVATRFFSRVLWTPVYCDVFLTITA